MIIITCYIGMLIFDLAVLAGTAYLVHHGWDPKWFWLAALMCAGSNPSRMLQNYKEVKDDCKAKER